MTTRSLIPTSLSVEAIAEGRTAGARAARALRFGGKALALVVSLGAHAGLALAFASAAPRRAHSGHAPSAEPIAIATVDLAPNEAAEISAEAPRAPLASPPAVSPSHAPRAAAAVRPEAPPSEPVAAPAVAESTPPAAPRFVLNVAPQGNAALASGAPSGLAQNAAAAVVSAPVPEAAVDTKAQLLSGSAASYTPEAEAAGVEANVPLEIVVDASGAVSSVRALAHIGYGLDEAALRAVRGYRFSPARRAGQALAVRMRWLMRFQLR